MQRKHSSVRRIQSQYVNEYHEQLKRSQLRKRKLIQRLTIATVAMTVIVGFLFVYHLGQRTIYSEKKQEYEQLSTEADNLELQKNTLLEEINLLKDDDYILDIARTNYFLSKDGELIFQIEDENNQSY